jgi:hypothetical protein
MRNNYFTSYKTNADAWFLVSTTFANEINYEENHLKMIYPNTWVSFFVSLSQIFVMI